MHASTSCMRPGAAATLAGMIVALLSASACRPAIAAEQHPPLMPTQDATVTYTVQPQGQPARLVTVRFGGGGSLMRIDPAAGPQAGQGYAVIDRVRRSVIAVMNPQHAYLELGARDDMHNPFLLDATMQFTHTGTSAVAGQPCTTWAISSGGQSSSTACITTSGIVLSEEGVDSHGQHGRLEATAVSFAPVPASDFVPPAGYTRVAHTAPDAPAGATPSGLPPLNTGATAH
ncbi:hypothetical protein FHR90_001085 [Endobacter medicaginis]|uniref:DUF4412 domain-containing protein n=2 Tax=Endobacter medicaginis TaxID=1181271 RepID=A0A839UTZ3_9PROT|nr:hypothetical protein [Endobacter medicaginis]MBB3173267.1 hypothetical protein [Endobacter medicaginis]MCX5476379.1 hypothetical protein [Endobacter medicaginis]